MHTAQIHGMKDLQSVHSTMKDKTYNKHALDIHAELTDLGLHRSFHNGTPRCPWSLQCPSNLYNFYMEFLFVL